MRAAFAGVSCSPRVRAARNPCGGPVEVEWLPSPVGSPVSYQPEMIPKPQRCLESPSFGGPARAQTVLALAAQSAAAAVEQLAKMASETVVKPGSAVSSETVVKPGSAVSSEGWDKAKGKSLAKAKIGATLPVLEHAAAADTAAPPKAAFLAPVSSVAAPKAEFRVGLAFRLSQSQPWWGGHSASGSSTSSLQCHCYTVFAPAGSGVGLHITWGARKRMLTYRRGPVFVPGWAVE